MRKTENIGLVKCGGETDVVVLNCVVGKCTCWSWWRKVSCF